jgi:hypothetical protein
LIDFFLVSSSTSSMTLRIIFYNARQFSLGKDVLPKIVCHKAVRIRRISCAVVVAFIERQEPAIFPCELCTELDRSIVHGKVNHAALEGEQQIVEISIFLILTDSIFSKDVFSSVFNGIWSFVSGIVDKLKGIFNFNWELPKIKLPHFSISGSFSLDPPSIPHFSVDWYKKAMGNGMILDSPTIFGMSGNSLLAGGEAGAEAVVGVSSLQAMIQNAVASQTGTMVNALSAALENVGGGGDITIPVYLGGTLLDETIITAQQRMALRSGGR